jgi:hypothetical protein
MTKKLGFKAMRSNADFLPNPILVKPSAENLLSLEQYKHAFLNGSVPKQPIDQIMGRIILGQKSEDFGRLSANPERKIGMFLGPDGLHELIGKPGAEMFKIVAHTGEYLQSKINAGYEFRLAVFPSQDAEIATTENFLDMVCRVHPTVAPLIEQYREHLDPRKVPFEVIQNMAGYSFQEVDDNGLTDPRYINTERLLSRSPTLATVRAFLYHVEGMRELFRGDGYTDRDGRRGCLEYIVARKMKITDFAERLILPIMVSC